MIKAVGLAMLCLVFLLQIAAAHADTEHVIVLDKTEVMLHIGAFESDGGIRYYGMSTQLSAAVPEGMEVRWESSDPSVAAVNSRGKVTSVVPGQCTVRCISREDPAQFAQAVISVRPLNGAMRNEQDYLQAGREEDGFYSIAETAGLYQDIVYGTSEGGRELHCYRVGKEDAAVRFLMVFGVHGFEDIADHDAVMLKHLAEMIVVHYLQHPQQLRDTALYIVPCANPDGLIDGRSQDGFGRCNLHGYDVNRDFPVQWKKNRNARGKTGDGPWTTAEARAIRNLTELIQPHYAADVHGYINRTYGSGELCAPFNRALGIRTYEYISGGMMAQWFATVADGAMLLEMPERMANGLKNGSLQQVYEAMIQAISECAEMWAEE